jgi:hypothetical protein
MFNYLIGTALLSLFIYLDGPSIVKNQSKIGLIKFKKINNLVSTNYTGYFKILWISMYMVNQALWISMVQYLNTTVSKIDRHSYRVTYVIKGKTYIMVVKPSRGPSRVLLISDENQLDVSHIIFPYLGPKENFHGGMYTPKFFNKKELVFELSNGDEKIFLENDLLQF